MYDILSTLIVLLGDQSSWIGIPDSGLVLFMRENLNLRKKSVLLFVAKLFEWRRQPQLVPFSVLH